MKIAITIIIIISSILHIKAEENDKKSEKNDINKIVVHENRYEKLVDLSLSYLEINPEFAFNCAYKAHEIANKTNEKSKSAECNIIMGDIFNSNNDHTSAISYYEDAISDFITIKDYHRIYSIYIKIAELHQKNEFNRKWLVEAMDNALLYAKKTNDTNAIIEVLFRNGDLHLQSNDYKSALMQYDNILELEKKDKRNIARVMARKAYIDIKRKEYHNALNNTDSSISICRNNNIDDLIYVCYGLKGEINDSLNMLEEAKSYYKEAINLAYNKKDYNYCSKYMYQLGILNKDKGDLGSAIEIFKILCDSTQTFKMYEICNKSFYQLAKCHAEQGEYKEAYELFNKYDIYYDSANFVKQEKKLKEIHTSYSITLKVEEMKSKELETYNNKSLRINLITSLTIIIVLSITLITFITLFSRNKILYHKNKETAYEQQLKIDKMENNLMEMQLKSSKESMINMALHIKSYIEYINPLKDDLKEAIDLPDNELRNRIKNIYLNIQNNGRLFSNTENVNKQINDIYKDFLDRLELKYPSITKSEKRLCVMLYIDLSSKEIAIITNTTLRSVETSRYRLRKKFNLQRDDDMVNFLRSI